MFQYSFLVIIKHRTLIIGFLYLFVPEKTMEAPPKPMRIIEAVRINAITQLHVINDTGRFLQKISVETLCRKRGGDSALHTIWGASTPLSKRWRRVDCE
jgi:hypothetical protein